MSTLTKERIEKKVNSLKADSNFLSKIHDRQLGCITKSWEDIAKIALTKVCVCGLGALGIVSEMVTRFGFGYGEKNGIKIVDFDNYDYSNFARQYGARIESVDINKATYTKILLEQLGLAEIIAYPLKIKPDNVDEIIKGSDIVIHAIDGIQGAIALAEACKKSDIVAIEGWGLMYGNVITHFPDTPKWTEVYGVTDLIDKDISELSGQDEGKIFSRILEKFTRIPGILDCYSEKSIVEMLKGRLAARTSVFIWGTAYFLFSQAVKCVLDVGNIPKAPIMTFYDPLDMRIFNYDLIKEEII